MKNTGKEYEILTKSIFEEILHYENPELKTIKILHNVILDGKSTTHQIDVLWKFRLFGIEYLTLVQAKDWNSTVQQSALLAFKGVLDDISGQPRGVFVTKTGYQHGAKEFADKNGIILYELREPTEKDFEGSINHIIIDLNIISPYINNFEIKADKEWLNQELQRHNIEQASFKLPRFHDMAGNIFLFDENFFPRESIGDLLEESTHSSLECVHKSIKLVNRYLKTDNPLMHFIKICSLEYDLSFRKENRKIDIDLNSIVGYILKNTLDGKETIFDKRGKLTPSKNH